MPIRTRVASSVETARRILESDLEQIAMILTTIVAAGTYGWIEGFAIESWRYPSAQVWWFLGHFSTYSLSMAILFACITGGFALIKGRSMFMKGKRYFVITFAGNYPFSWLVEDFAFFWFYPDPNYRLSSDVWTNWFLGGVWLQDPWRSPVRIWIPTWYFLVLLFWLAMMWYAHRCTVYDNLVKDEIAREIVPHPIEIPSEVKKPVRVPEEVAERPSAPVTEEAQAPKEELGPKPEAVIVEPQHGAREAPEAPTPTPEHAEVPVPILEPHKRSPEAEEALKKLREKWLRSNA
jgi:hypothetical protein